MERGWRSGARLPIAPSPEPHKPTPCDRDDRHTGGIRFELWRYGKRVGAIRLCDACIRHLITRPDPDPRHVEENAA